MLFFIVVGLNNKSRLSKLLFGALVLDFVDKSRVEDTYALRYFKSKGDLKYALL